MIAKLGDEVRFVVDLKQARRSNVDPFRLLDIIKYDNAMLVELYRENYKSYDELALCVNNMQKLCNKYKTGV